MTGSSSHRTKPFPNAVGVSGCERQGWPRLGEQADCSSDESRRRQSRMAMRPHSVFRGSEGRCHTEALCVCVCACVCTCLLCCECLLHAHMHVSSEAKGNLWMSGVRGLCSHRLHGRGVGVQGTVLTRPSLQGQGGPHPYSESAWAFFPDLTLALVSGGRGVCRPWPGVCLNQALVDKALCLSW